MVLHEHDIRKSRSGDYAFLSDKDKREQFLADIESLIRAADFDIIAEIWPKIRLPEETNVYGLSLTICMVEFLRWLPARVHAPSIIHLIFESRGPKEDAELELAFRRVCDGTTKFTAGFAKTNLTFVLRFVKKSANSTGLQIADLIARPIGLNYLRPKQANRAFEAIKDKMITEMWSQRMKEDFF